MRGTNNPVWTGNSLCKCGGKKAVDAHECRTCSFTDNKRSGSNNGRFIKENRQQFLDNQRAAKIARTTLSNTLRSLGIKKNTKTERILKYSFEEFRAHFEAQFEPWMNWNNRGNKSGQWSVDHIIPVKYFLTNNIKDVSIINALWNLRPIDSKTNIIKSDLLISEAEKLIDTELKIALESKQL